MPANWKLGQRPAGLQHHLSQPCQPTDVNPWTCGSLLSAPALPDACIQLRRLLDARAVDLCAVAEVIRGDIGLTVELMRLGSKELGKSSPEVLHIGNTVVHLGSEKVKALVNQAARLSSHPRGKAGFQTCNRFWMHARLTALIAEQLGTHGNAVNHEEAYTAGLLRHLGALPFVLGWKVPEFDQADPGECALFLARGWDLPTALVEVVHGSREYCSSPQSLELLELVNSADKHAFRLELGCDY